MAYYSTVNFMVSVNNQIYIIPVPIYRYNNTLEKLLGSHSSGSDYDGGFVLPEKILFDDNSTFNERGKKISLAFFATSNGDYDHPDALIDTYLRYGESSRTGESIGLFSDKNGTAISNSGLYLYNTSRKIEIKYIYDSNGNTDNSIYFDVRTNNNWTYTEVGMCFLITTDNYVIPVYTKGKMLKNEGFMNPNVCKFTSYNRIEAGGFNPTICELENVNIPSGYSAMATAYNNWYDTQNYVFFRIRNAITISSAITYENFSNLFTIRGSINVDPLSPGGTNEGDVNSGDTGGTWTTQHTGELSGHTEYNDLEASLFRVYALNKRELSDLAQSIWNPSILQAVLQNIGSIDNLILGLYSYPFEVDHDSTEININFNWLSKWGDGVIAKGYNVREEIKEIDFGYIEVPYYSKNFYNYQPFSSAQLYIPYIGFVPLKMNEILGAKLNLKFNINVTTGDFCAIVTVKDKKDPLSGNNYDMTIGYYNGNMARPLPLSRQDMFEVYKAGATLLSSASQIGSGINLALGGISGSNIAQGFTKEFISNIKSTKFNYNNPSNVREYRNQGAVSASGDPFNWGNVFGHGSNTDELKNGIRKTNSGVSNAISAVTSANAPIERSSMLGGVVGRCAEQKAFILLTYPHQNTPQNQSMLGYATNAEGPLSAGFQGYTEVREIRISDPNATSSEIAEIEEIVRGGIII